MPAVTGKLARLTGRGGNPPRPAVSRSGRQTWALSEPGAAIRMTPRGLCSPRRSALYTGSSAVATTGSTKASSLGSTKASSSVEGRGGLTRLEPVALGGYSACIMSDNFASPVDLDRIRADLAEAKARVRGLENLLDLAERWYGQDRRPSLRTDDSEPGDALSHNEVEADAPTGPLTGLGARDAAVELLKSTGSVWGVAAATREMRRLGWHTKSDKPRTVVRSAMMRDPRIERVEAGQFRYRSENQATDPRATLLPADGFSDYPATGNGTRTDAPEKPVYADGEAEPATA
jgi:hypothetical protein